MQVAGRLGEVVLNCLSRVGAGLEPQRPTATDCQSGGHVSVMAFALELMDGDAVQNDYCNWAQWGNSQQTPIQRPDAP